MSYWLLFGVHQLSFHRDLVISLVMSNYTDLYQCYLIAILPSSGSANETVWQYF
jgi:hypothetical protein